MIELKHLSKTFETAGGRVDALKDVSLTIPDGDVYGIIGMSGAGKSTLVRCINMLERPTEGEVIVNGQRLDTMTPAQLRAARREITMIFQRFNLLMQRTCLRNVCFRHRYNYRCYVCFRRRCSRCNYCVWTNRYCNYRCCNCYCYE